MNALVSSPAGILAVLTGVCAFYFFLEKKTGWKLFNILPPLIFIYATPVVLSNTDVIPAEAEVYGSIRSLVLPMMLVLLLIKVDVGAAVSILGRGVFVLLFGTLGVVLGAPVAFLLVKGWLGPESWKAFGTLAGSWTGGTGNMAAVSEMIDTGGTEFGLAVLGDNAIYVIWLPIMLASKHLASRFGKFTGVDPERTRQMEAAAKAMHKDEGSPETRHFLYLLAIGLSVTWLSDSVATALPEYDPYVSTGTWRILVVTVVGIALSFTGAKAIPGSHDFAMALVYLYVARMGATANLEGVASQALPFLAGALVWIFIHGGFCLLGARLLRVDVHTAAIASAANIGGAASAPIVAAYHNEALVPVSILMALIGYAIGNFAGYGAALLCQLVA